MLTEVTTRRVLVVDDDPSMRDILHRVLTRAGYEVTTACDAEEALLMISGGGDIHAVISDIHLPGMDGVTMINWILARHGHVKAFLLTAYGSVVEYLEATKSGAVEYLLKPVNLTHLVYLVEQAIGRPAEMPSEYWVS